MVSESPEFASGLDNEKGAAAGSVDRGRARFRNEYACRLSSAGRVGGTSAPALDEVGEKFQRDWVRAYLIDPKE